MAPGRTEGLNHHSGSGGQSGAKRNSKAKRNHDDDEDDDEEEDDGPPPFVMDMTWILAVIVLTIVVLALIAVGVKLYERFSRRSGYDEIPAAEPEDHYYDEAEEQPYAHGRV